MPHRRKDCQRRRDSNGCAALGLVFRGYAHPSQARDQNCVENDRIGFLPPVDTWAAWHARPTHFWTREHGGSIGIVLVMNGQFLSLHADPATRHGKMSHCPIHHQDDSNWSLHVLWSKSGLGGMPCGPCVDRWKEPDPVILHTILISCLGWMA